MRKGVLRILGKLGLVPVSTLNAVQHNCEILRRQRAALKAENKSLKDKANRPQNWMQRIANGEDFFDSYFAEFPSMKSKYRLCLRSFIHSLSRENDLLCSFDTFSKLADAQFMYSEKFYKRTLQILDQIPKSMILRYLPYTYLDSQVHENCLDIDELTKLINRYIGESNIAEALRYAELLAKAGKFNLFYEKIDQLQKYSIDSEQIQNQIQWYKNFKKENENSPGGGLGPSINLGILNYKTLDVDRSSNNIGDWVQTLALISNLVRYQRVNYVSENKELADFVNSCKCKVFDLEKDAKEESVAVNLVEVNRDFSNNKRLPENTWTFVFGWYMHQNFNMWYDFPLNKNILPIFISFHVNRKSILSDSAVRYLKQYEPIGCRDWTTVNILTSRGIKAFFSGCVTSTIGQIFDGNLIENNGRIADVESKSRIQTNKSVDFFSNVSSAFKYRTLVENLIASYNILNKYKEYDEIYTSRLHCYLPLRSIGKHPHFTNRTLSDPRFDGLIGISDEEFLQMRMAIKLKIQKMYEYILSGKSKDEVYKYWQGLCKEDVESAKKHILKNLIVPEIKNFDLGAVTDTIKQNCKTYNSLLSVEVNLAFAVDQNLFQYLGVVLESIAHNTKASLNVVLLLRKIADEDIAHLVNTFKNIQFTVYSLDSVKYGDDLALLKHITVSTMDRLLLPVICNNLEKILYLDVDIIVTGDIAELYGIDVSNYRYAGKHSDSPGWASCDNLISRAALLCSSENASKLRNTAYHMGTLDYQAANAGVTLMNLELMRKEDFAQRYIPLVEQYQLNDQDVLNLYCQGNRLEIDPNWNVYATQESIQDAKLIHFAGPVKPWGSLYIRGKEIFCNYQKNFRDRETK